MLNIVNAAGVAKGFTTPGGAMSSSPSGPGRVPAAHAAFARRLRAAEDRLYPLAMVDADRYQRAVLLVGLLARRLAAACGSLDELAAAESRVRGWLQDTAGTERVSLDGLDTDLVVDAAMSHRFRELLTDQAAQLQRAAIDRARAAGLAWAVLEEPDPAAWSTGAARWVESHVATGTVMVRSVAADPTTGTPTYQLEVLGGASVRVQTFVDRDEWAAAAAEVRRSFESES
jgi:hypothetical protein